jgi:hypothetical protein
MVLLSRKSRLKDQVKQIAKVPLEPAKILKDIY